MVHNFRNTHNASSLCHVGCVSAGRWGPTERSPRFLRMALCWEGGASESSQLLGLRSWRQVRGGLLMEYEGHLGLYVIELIVLFFCDNFLLYRLCFCMIPFSSLPYPPWTRSYTHFCKCGKTIDEAFERGGAKVLAARPVCVCVWDRLADFEVDLYKAKFH